MSDQILYQIEGHFFKCREPVIVMIYDVNGRLVENSDFDDTRSASINVNQFSEGIYFFITKICGESYRQKIVITE